MPDIFEPALRQMTKEGTTLYGPISFKSYLAANNLAVTGNTPSYISIDSFEALPSSLKTAGAMVFRLGRADLVGGSETAFALTTLGQSLTEMFLIDAALRANIVTETFLPTTSVRELFPFHILPQLSEPNVLSYAFASGLISDALVLDVRGALAPPATGASNFSFSFLPHEHAPTTLLYRTGQVEIDAMFVGCRGGKLKLFVLEAKVGQKSASLAKHKLAYAVMAVAQRIPPDMEIVPVYARFCKNERSLDALIVECTFPITRDGGPPTISSLKPVSIRALSIPSDVAIGF
jgi:hypothetical protein